MYFHLVPGLNSQNGNDLRLVLQGVSKFWNGDKHVYIDQTGYFYPPQFLFLFGLLLAPSFSAALWLVQGLSVMALGAVVWVWSRVTPGSFLVCMICLGATLGGVELVVLGQFGTAITLLCLSAGLVLARDEEWVWAGMFLGVGTIRLANAIPVGFAILVLAARKAGPKGVGFVLFGFLLFLVPLGAYVTLVYPDWPHEYLISLRSYTADGLVGKIIQDFGFLGMGMLVVLGSLLSGAVIWKSPGRNQLAAVLAISALFAPFQLDYSAVFGIPALIRMAGWGRTGAGVVLAVVAIPWLGVALASLLGLDFNAFLPNVEIVLLIFIVTLLLRGNLVEARLQPEGLKGNK
jgi:hypothetical protein